MQYMILRRADDTSESPDFPSPELKAAVPGAKWLQHSASAVRMKRTDGEWSFSEGPFDDVAVAGFTFVEAPNRASAEAHASLWPTADAEGEAVLEVREAGCPGGCVGFDTGEKPKKSGFAILLRSDEVNEADLAPPAEVIDIMNRANRAAIEAGTAISGEGLKSTAKGSRVKINGGKPQIVDGPFTEIKELIAGYWLIDVPALDDAIAWVRNYPYPNVGTMEVELRKVAL
ncbi:YciI family protein [Pseudoduganella sp. RAF53_2]|uniref:YciI family protein n=1 Tax=unclassified Pseudoduganella TaxID=2637179 RepID=UPI003F95E1E1